MEIQFNRANFQPHLKAKSVIVKVHVHKAIKLIVSHTVYKIQRKVSLLTFKNIL